MFGFEKIFQGKQEGGSIESEKMLDAKQALDDAFLHIEERLEGGLKVKENN